MLICKLLDEMAILPSVAHPGTDLGFDIYSLQYVTLYQNMTTKVRTGIAVKFIDDNAKFSQLGGKGGVFTETIYGLLLRDRSSMAANGITISGGVIDNEYTGEILVLLTNHNTEPYEIKSGDKIAQMIPQQVLTNTKIDWVKELPISSRQDKGFGSSGR